jgi:dTDP-4-dehydrorhamnose reductase
MRIAVTGARGQLGSELSSRLAGEVIGLTRPDFDLADVNCIARALRAIRPHAVINAAAFTNVEGAESDEELCFRVNAAAVEVIAETCRDLGSVLIQISTDYVFAGIEGRHTPFRESDAPAPRGVYARSKWAGEIAAARCERHFIVRTCGLYAPLQGAPTRGRSFVETMLALAIEGKSLRVVDDQMCTPTYVPHLAEAIEFLIGSEAFGLYHITNAGQTTWFEFAREIFRLSGLPVRLDPISTREYVAKAPRPQYSVLSTHKYDLLGGPKLPSWENALLGYFADVDLKQQVIS